MSDASTWATVACSSSPAIRLATSPAISWVNQRSASGPSNARALEPGCSVTRPISQGEGTVSPSIGSRKAVMGQVSCLRRVSQAGVAVIASADSAGFLEGDGLGRVAGSAGGDGDADRLALERFGELQDIGRGVGDGCAVGVPADRDGRDRGPGAPGDRQAVADSGRAGEPWPGADGEGAHRHDARPAGRGAVVVAGPAGRDGHAELLPGQGRGDGEGGTGGAGYRGAVGKPLVGESQAVRRIPVTRWRGDVRAGPDRAGDGRGLGVRDVSGGYWGRGRAGRGCVAV